MKTILIVSAHADDETLGCAGTMLRHRQQCDRLFWVLATEPTGDMAQPDFVAQRERQIAEVSDAIGYEKIWRLRLPAAGLDALPPSRVIAALQTIIDSVHPDIIYSVHRNDVHGDHRALFDALWVAAKPIHGRPAADIYCYETLSSTNLAHRMNGKSFAPDYFVDISGLMEQKKAINGLYQSEFHTPPHPRSLDAVEALARYRGAAMGVHYAEAFVTLRRFWSAS